MIFVDTSGWYAVEVEDDVNHEAACKFLAKIASGKYGIIVTSDYVLDETLTLLRARRDLATATEFINKGVKAFISWDDKVSLFHTDRASTLLLKLLVENKMTVSEAVATVMNNIGADPDYKSSLRYFPTQAGSVRAKL